MMRRPPRYTSTDPLCPSPTLFRLGIYRALQQPPKGPHVLPRRRLTVAVADVQALRQAEPAQVHRRPGAQAQHDGVAGDVPRRGPHLRDDAVRPVVARDLDAGEDADAMRLALAGKPAHRLAGAGLAGQLERKSVA